MKQPKHQEHNEDYDVCIIGSGAGAGPIAFELSQQGYNIIVLEKGRWFSEQDFYKDEQLVRHKIFRSQLDEERHILEEPTESGRWSSSRTARFWGGNIVGGASNFMSAYFHRLKPNDFRLLSTYGPIEGANITDWPIQYDDLEPYYTKVENIIGVSGRVVKHRFLEPRSTDDFPYPPLAEHPVAAEFDQACEKLGVTSLPLARGILSRAKDQRLSCEYSGYCGSYGCHTGAKGSARAALMDDAVATGHCKIIPQAKVYKLATDQQGQVISAHYHHHDGGTASIRATLFVVACYAIESARLLLSSIGPKHPKGIGNRYNQVGKNLHCCAGGTGHGIFDLTQYSPEKAKQRKIRGPFFNRTLQAWYEINDHSLSKTPLKGGTLDFVFDPPAPTADANRLKWQNQKLIWGTALKQRLKAHFTQTQDLKFEVFCDWLCNDNCFVSLDTSEKDKWGDPVAKIRAGFHPHDVKVSQYLVDRGVEIMQAMGAKEAWGNVYTNPTSNLVAGGCRFGDDPTSSVLNKACRVHDCDNLYLSDGSFMPNGGSVTPTMTIYANAFRIADLIATRLG